MNSALIQVRLNIPRNVYLRSRCKCCVVDFPVDFNFQDQYLRISGKALQMHLSQSRVEMGGNTE